MNVKCRREDYSITQSSNSNHDVFLRIEISTMCSDGRNTYHAINRFGSNILNTIAVYSLYKRVVYLSVLYGSELLNNMKTKDTNNLQIFQHFIAKHIQSFNRRTRSDVCEAIL